MVLADRVVRRFRGPKDPSLWRHVRWLLVAGLVLGLVRGCLTEVGQGQQAADIVRRAELYGGTQTARYGTCSEVQRLIRQRWGVEGQGTWASDVAEVTWSWTEQGCTLTVTPHRPASSAG